MEDTKYKKLPKYAQDEISRLRNNLQSTEEKLHAMTGERLSNTQFRHGPGYKNLPDKCNVRFILAEHESIEANIVDGVLRIYGSRSISVEPRASNSIYLRVR